jgi:hypothetical protein
MLSTILKNVPKNNVCRAFSTTNVALTSKPTIKPSSPDFSSGPCKKRPGWSLDALSAGAYGRSHRSVLGKEKLKKCIEDSKRILGIPDDYHLGIVPVSIDLLNMGHFSSFFIACSYFLLFFWCSYLS